MTSHDNFTIIARPSPIDPAERRRRLALVYELLAQAAARADAAQPEGAAHDQNH